MKRYLLFLMVVLLASLDINAQMFNVYVKYSDGAVASNVEIYSFVTEKLAKNSVANYKNSYQVEVGSPKKNTGHATTGADGFCMLEADRDGYIVVEIEGSVLVCLAAYNNRDRSKAFGPYRCEQVYML